MRQLADMIHPQKLMWILILPITVVLLMLGLLYGYAHYFEGTLSQKQTQTTHRVTMQLTEIQDKLQSITTTVNQHFITTLIGKIIPNMGLRWLADCELVFQHWWDAVVFETTENFITRLITEAAEKIHYPLIQAKQNDIPLSNLF